MAKYPSSVVDTSCNQGCESTDKSANRDRESRPRLGSGASFFWVSLSNLVIDDNFRISNNLGLGLAANISAEVPKSKKELAGKVEEPEGEEKELEAEPEPSLPEPEPPLPEPDEEEREQEFQLMVEKLNSTLSRALERGQRRRRRR